MPLAVVLGVIIGLIVLIAVAIHLFGDHGGIRPVARPLRWISFIVTSAIAVAMFPTAWDDSGAFALALVGVPVLVGLLAVLADLVDSGTAIVTWTAGGVMLAWSLVTALGLGFYFLAPSILMLVAAACSMGDRHHVPQ